MNLEMKLTKTDDFKRRRSGKEFKNRTRQYNQAHALLFSLDNKNLQRSGEENQMIYGRIKFPCPLGGNFHNYKRVLF